MSEIAHVRGWEAFDSRGTPTVGCTVTLRDGSAGRAVAPSGASTGRYEAHELRDEDANRFEGRGVSRAVRNVGTELADAVRGMDAREWRAVDARLAAADGTESMERLGANAVLAVSLASCIAGAASERTPLHVHLGEGRGDLEIPLPMVNVVSGGAHASGAIDLQDVLVVPLAAGTFAEAIAWAWQVRRGTRLEAEERGMPTALVADEGGLGLPLARNEDAFEIVVSGAHRAGLEPGVDVALAVDVAANQLQDGDAYRLAVEGRALDSDELGAQVAAWCEAYPIVSVEDALSDDDWSGWTSLADRLPAHVQLLGDDLFVTNAERIRRGYESKAANAVLLKPNQAGTLARTEQALLTARDSGYRTVLSARSGDTEDPWLADLGVGWRTGQIKVGSTMRSERTAKWNRLLEIEAEVEAGGGTSRLATPFRDGTAP